MILIAAMLFLVPAEAMHANNTNVGNNTNKTNDTNEYAGQ